MYKVLLDGTLMCDSRIEELALSNPVVKLEEGKVGSFSFIIPPDHPMIDAVKRRKSIIEVVEDDEILFCGICIEVTEDFYKQKTVYCESELTYLNDTVQRPCRYAGMTVRELLEAYVSKHNSQTDESKQFSVGMVTVEDSNDYISCYTNMESTMACIKADLVDDLGGFLQVRYQNSIRYLDYLAESLNTNKQTIKLGKNLIDYISNIDSTDIATAIIPLGAKLAESSIEGLEERLTIKSVNDGLDYVFNQDAVNSYGWIYKTVTWDDVTTPEALKAKAEKYLAEVQFENVVIEAKALDLHFEDSSVEKFKLSDKIRVVSAPHGLNKYFRLTKLTRNLNNPEKDTITLGKDERLSLTAKTNKENVVIKQEIEKSSNSTKQQAIANATALIANAMGGFVVKTNDELLIMDTDNIETATKVWRWNINGLGYSKNGYAGPYELAMTMDGAIVADFITAGNLNANLLKAGIIKSPDGKSYWNLETGEIVMNSYATTESVAEQVTDSKIDGRNYVLDSAEPQRITSSLSYKLSPSREKMNKEKLVLSLYIMSNVRPTQQLDITFTIGTTTRTYPFMPNVFTPNKYQGYSFNFPPTLFDDNDTLNITCTGFETADYRIKNVKLEVGDARTEWTYAPEDLPDTFGKYSTTTEMRSEIKQTADEINIEVSKKVDESNVVSAINVSSDEIELKSNRISIESDNFKLSKEGNIEMLSGKIKIYGTVTKYASDYTQADADRANDISIGLVSPTVEDFEKLDLNGDGVINALDAILIGRLVNGTDTQREIATSIEISPLTSHCVLKTDGVAIGANGLFAKSANAEKMYMKTVNVMNEGGGFSQGKSGTYTTADGKTVTVTNGIITSIA